MYLNTEFAAVIIIGLFLCFILLLTILNNTNKPDIPMGPSEPPRMPFMTKITDLQDNLSLLVDLEFMGTVTIPKMTNDIPIITDFEYYHKEIAGNVIKSLTPAFYSNAFMLGLTKEYVNTQVVRLTMYKLLTYMGEHNLSLK